MATTTKTLWNIDPTHTEVQFKVKHLVISTVTGRFDTFEGNIESEGESFEDAKAWFEADISSVNTGNTDRDNHLKSDDFFNAESFPKLKFESTSFEPVGEGRYKLTGNMTIRDITKEIELDVVHGGTADDPYGNTKAGFEITGPIKRKEFGLNFDAVTKAGNMVVGDDINLQLNVQVIQN